MTPTPRTDAVVKQYSAARAIMMTILAKDMELEIAELQARLMERTEQSMATALRDAETIRRLRAGEREGG